MSNGNKQIIKVTKFVENLLVTQVISTLTCTSLERNWSQPWEDKSNLVHTAAHKKKSSQISRAVGCTAKAYLNISQTLLHFFETLKVMGAEWQKNDVDRIVPTGFLLTHTIYVRSSHTIKS